MTKHFVMVPVPGYLTVHVEPRFMIGMLGMNVQEDEVHHFLERTGYYDKRQRPANEGHWFSVVEPGNERYFVGGEDIPEGEENKGHKFQAGDFVAMNLSARDHMLTLGETRVSFMPSREVIGVMHLGDNDRGMRFDACGYWVLLQQDDEVTTRIGGASTIVLPDATLDAGQRSSEALEGIPGQKAEPGIRVKYMRVMDAGKLASCKKGDVVCISTAAEVKLTIAGNAYVAVPTGAVIGVIDQSQFPKWVAPQEKRA